MICKCLGLFRVYKRNDFLYKGECHQLMIQLERALNYNLEGLYQLLMVYF